MEENNLILLTGAGFTKNFGGYLGEEMWAKVFNDPRHDNEMRRLLLDNHDFEVVYAEVLESKIQQRINMMTGAVDYAYELLDMAVAGGDLYKRFFENFLTLFTGNNANKKLLWFTLNQDLLVERESEKSDDSKKIKSAGVDYDLCSGFLTLPQESELKETFNKVEKSINDSKISYIKLHGSCKWLFSFENERQAMAVGIKKLELIEQEPLLRIYSAKLRKTIEEGGKKLMIIGYGFKDDHINRVLIEGVEKYGLRLYILNPKSITEFESYLKYSNPLFYRKCWDGLFGYFTGTLEDVFRKGHSGEMSLLKEIEIRLTQ